MAVVETADGPRFLRDIIDDDREFYLGAAGREGGWHLSFLLKILDSAMRLHVQAHPSTQFANEVMGMPYGKLECYYILHVRDGISPVSYTHLDVYKRQVWSCLSESMSGCQIHAALCRRLLFPMGINMAGLLPIERRKS